MKRWTSLLTCVALLATAAPSAWAAPLPGAAAGMTSAGRAAGVVRFARPAGLTAGAPAASSASGGRFIVGLRAAAKSASARVAAAKTLAATGANPVRTAPSGAFMIVEVPRGPAGTAAASALKSSPAARYVEEVRETFRAHGLPDDPDYPEQWGMHQAGIHQAWAESTGSPSVTVAVVDTGVDYTHPELAGRVVKGADWIGGDADPQDEHGHGTHVAGIVAAHADNGLQVAGAAPGCTILAERVLNEQGWGTPETVALGIEDAILRDADIINMSLGGEYPSAAVAEAVRLAQQHGIVVVASAGNSGSSQPSYPASIAGVVSVAAITRDGMPADFSNHGPTVDIAAPGVGILSLRPGGRTVAMSGTSMAAPLVSGTVALVRSHNPSLTASQAIDAVLSTADRTLLVSRWVGWGYGVVDAAAALGVNPRLRDADEPANDSTAGAVPLVPGEWTERTLTGPADVDVFSVELTAGRRYLLRTSLLIDIQTRMTLVDATGRTVLSVTGRGGEERDVSSWMPYAAKTSGTYFLKVADHFGFPERPWPTPGCFGICALDLGPAITPEQISGASRYATAVNVSRSAFSTGAPTVILATSADHADAMSAGALAGAWRAPILLVPPSGTVPSVVRNEISRLGATRAVMIGGPSAVNAWVEAQCKACLTGAQTVQRLSGRNRYETCAAVAREAKTRWSQTRAFPNRVFLVSGVGYADGLLASPLAYRTGAPVLLTDPRQLSGSTLKAIQDLRATEVVLVGYDRMDVYAMLSPIFLKCPRVEEVWGVGMPDIPGTSVAVASYAESELRLGGWARPVIASSWAYADSITVAPLAGERASYLLLTPSSRIDGQVWSAMSDHMREVRGVTFMGGIASVAGLEPKVRADIVSALQ